MDAYSLLLTRGLIRVGLNVPANAEFVIDSVDDPYQCLPGTQDVSVHRRPLPSANLRFLSAVMWDGRESSLISAIVDDLAHQATVFDEWSNLPDSMKGLIRDARSAIARGQDIFNLKWGHGATSFVGTCTVCHDSPNAGSHSVKAPLDLGLTKPEVAPYLPVYTGRGAGSVLSQRGGSDARRGR